MSQITSLRCLRLIGVSGLLAGVLALMCAISPLAAEEAPAKPKQLFDGKTLSGWRVVDKFDFEKHGKVEVVEGEMVLGKGTPASGVAYTKKLPRTNYELSLDARRIDGDDFFCGLTFPVGKEYCTLIVGGWGGGVTGLSNIDNLSAVDNETTGYTEFKRGQWYRVRVRVTDEAITAWLDKDEIVAVNRKDRKFSIWWEQEPVRPLGIATWNTKAGLRNIQLTELPAGK